MLPFVAVAGLEESGGGAGDPFAAIAGDPAFVDELRVGDCFVDAVGRGETEDAYEVDEVETVPCDGPHEYEVTGLIELERDSSPEEGGDDFFDEADQLCDDALWEYATEEAYADPDLWIAYYWPSQWAWRAGDRTLTCAVASDTPRSGSIAG